MTPKRIAPRSVFAATLCTALLIWGNVALADDQYKPGEFLTLDLATAVLSPKPLGPASEFAPVTVEAKADRANESPPAAVASKAAPDVVVGGIHVATRAEKPSHAVRTRLAHRRGNPLDAQAFDTRIQVWPCRSGGICNWKR
jgi:hypothetical protein